ncbi:MAG: hypothetical protein B5M54_00655 [Candidatus Aminicenantes bacterium 4484_214]|nr:MAG: hypothetical protein B5M54_00655 [Candidatus Aminicenantes bacterium 4484_214]HDJ22637.1 hypothetical protein [Candidatus Aminicenantes bacterium]
MGNLLIGSATAKLDKSGRLKIPERFRETLEENYGKHVFITCLNNHSIQIYPLSIWQTMTKTTAKGFIHLRPDIYRFLIQVNHLGAPYEIDSKGRVLIQQELREKAELDGEVEVLGLNTHLEVWNKKRLQEMMLQHPLTEEDFEKISSLPGEEPSSERKGFELKEEKP